MAFYSTSMSYLMFTASKNTHVWAAPPSPPVWPDPPHLLAVTQTTNSNITFSKENALAGMLVYRNKNI